MLLIPSKLLEIETRPKFPALAARRYAFLFDRYIIFPIESPPNQPQAKLFRIRVVPLRSWLMSSSGRWSPGLDGFAWEQLSAANVPSYF